MPLTALSRSYVYSPGTKIVSAQVNAEFNSLFNLLNGTDLAHGVKIGGTSLPTAYVASNPPLYIEGQTVFNSPLTGAVVRVYKTGDDNSRVDLYNNGNIYMVASQSSANVSTDRMTAIGTLISYSNDVGNVGAGEDILWDSPVGAYVMKGTNSYLDGKTVGMTAANGNNKRFRFYLNPAVGADVLIADSGVITPNNKPWFFYYTVSNDNDAPSTVNIHGEFVCDATRIPFFSTVSWDFDVANNLKFTAEAVADNDIVMKHLRWIKGAI